MSGEKEKASIWNRGRALWDADEWRHIILFLGLWAFLTSAAFYKAYTTGVWGLTTFGSDLLFTFTLSTFLMGIFFVRMFWGKGIMSFRKMFRNMLKGSLVFTIFFLAIIYLVLVYSDEADLSDEDASALEGYEIVIAIVVMFIGFYFVGLFVFLVGFVMCMGLVGIVYLLTVGFAPPFLRRVRTPLRRWWRRSSPGPGSRMRLPGR